MGDIDDDDYEPTAQQMYYGRLRFLQNYGPAAEAEKLFGYGPPPPERRDGVIDKICWHEYHPPTVAQYMGILDELLAAGSITAAEADAQRAAVDGAPSTEDVKRLKPFVGRRRGASGETGAS